jgi:hypothetical protein
MSKTKKIPDALRNAVWNKYIGLEKGTGMCFCCNLEIISRGNYDCGHIISRAKGGETMLQNLRPVCGKCNKSMGTKDMNLFKKECGFQIESQVDFSEPIQGPESDIRSKIDDSVIRSKIDDSVIRSKIDDSVIRSKIEITNIKPVISGTKPRSKEKRICNAIKKNGGRCTYATPNKDTPRCGKHKIEDVVMAELENNLEDMRLATTIPPSIRHQIDYMQCFTSTANQDINQRLYDEFLESSKT